MLDEEKISYSLRFRPTGIVSLFKSLMGFGVTYWFITDQRLIETTRIGGGFTFKDIPHKKISSVEYGSKVSLSALGIGVLLIIGGLGLLVVGGVGSGVILILFLIGIILIMLTYWRRRQVLLVKGSGSVEMALRISKGEQVDDFLWYLHAERTKQTEF